MADPARPVPAPLAVTGILYLEASFIMDATSAVDSGLTATSGSETTPVIRDRVSIPYSFSLSLSSKMVFFSPTIFFNSSTDLSRDLPILTLHCFLGLLGFFF